MKRRHFIATGTGVVGAAALHACTSQSTPEATTSTDLPTVQWRMAASWPNALDVLLGAAQRVCDGQRPAL